MTTQELSKLEKIFNERGFVLAAEVSASQLAVDVVVIGSPPSPPAKLKRREVRVQDLGIRIEFFAMAGVRVEPSEVVRAWKAYLIECVVVRWLG